MATTMTTARERSRMAELLGSHAPSTAQKYGEASSLPPTLAMQFGDFMTPAFEAAQQVFPESNPYGSAIEDFFLGSAPDSARRMAEGEPNVLADTRGPNPLNWHLKPESVDMAAAMPFGLAGKAAGAGAAGVGMTRDEMLRRARLSMSGALETKLKQFEKDPLHHPIGGQKLDKPVGEYSYNIEPEAGIADRRIIQPADLNDSWILRGFGDRARADGHLTNVDGVDLSEKVHLQGGPGYGRRYGHDDRAEGDSAVWASMPDALSRVVGPASSKQVLDSGRDAHLMYLPMGFNTVDSNMMVGETLARQLRSAKLSKATIAAANKAVRGGKKGWADFPGVESPDLEELLRGATFDRRKQLAAALSNKSVAGLRGIPDVQAARIAITEPGLRDTPIGWGGQSVSRLDRDPLMKKSPDDARHRTYGANASGRWLGGFEAPVPYTLLFPETAFTAAGKSAEHRYRSAFSGNAPHRVDNEWVDSVSDWIDLYKQHGLGALK